MRSLSSAGLCAEHEVRPSSTSVPNVRAWPNKVSRTQDCSGSNSTIDASPIATGHLPIAEIRNGQCGEPPYYLANVSLWDRATWCGAAVSKATSSGNGPRLSSVALDKMSENKCEADVRLSDGCCRRASGRYARRMRTSIVTHYGSCAGAQHTCCIEPQHNAKPSVRRNI